MKLNRIKKDIEYFSEVVIDYYRVITYNPSSAKKFAN